jgi:hypothetical protein
MPTIQHVAVLAVAFALLVVVALAVSALVLDRVDPDAGRPES